MAGRLDGRLDGRPLSFIAAETRWTLESASARNLFKLRQVWRMVSQPLLYMLEREKITLVVRMPLLGTVEIYPKPSFFARMLLPKAGRKSS